MVLGVIGFIMSLIAVLAYTGVTAWQKQTVRLAMENQAQSFFYVLTEKLRQAQPSSVAISNYAPTTEMNMSMITFTETNQTNPVSIYLKTVKGTGSIQDRQIWLLDPEYVTNTSTASYSGGQVLASNVVSLYFTYPKISDTTRIQVSLSMEQYPFKNKPPVDYQATQVIYVRN